MSICLGVFLSEQLYFCHILPIREIFFIWYDKNTPMNYKLTKVQQGMFLPVVLLLGSQKFFLTVGVPFFVDKVMVCIQGSKIFEEKILKTFFFYFYFLTTLGPVCNVALAFIEKI